MLKDNDLIFVFDPPVNEMSGLVRVHYELYSEPGIRYAKVACLELKEKGLMLIGSYFRNGYRFE